VLSSAHFRGEGVQEVTDLCEKSYKYGVIAPKWVDLCEKSYKCGVIAPEVGELVRKIVQVWCDCP